MVNQADIHGKVVSREVEERRDAVEQLRHFGEYCTGNEQAWQDLIRLTHDENSDVRWRAADVLVYAFQHSPDKKQAWENLHRLAHDENGLVRWYATDVFGAAFQHIPDKEQAWEDLHKLAQEDSYVREGAANALGHAFQHIPDKEQAWQDLHRLTQDEHSDVHRHAASALGTAFQHIPDKEQAWEDLHRLTQVKESYVREGAANALGAVFTHIPNKRQAWEDLYRLTQDEDSSVRWRANHSLGRASIFKTAEAKSEESFKKELEKALEFFEKSSKSKEAAYLPSGFCLPFYRSFYAVTFDKAGAEAEVQKYLAEAKDATEGSKSKGQLLEAVENLANALKQAKSLREANLDIIQHNLNTCRQYCENAAGIIGAAEGETPGAARVLRRGLPIIDERIKEIISEIQEKARAVCKLTQGTALEDLGVELNQQGDTLSKIRDPLGLEKSVDTLQFILSEMCAKIPEDKRGFVRETHIPHILI